MAGLPPDTIHVKRKRGTDDGPVEFLRLERSKRYRSLSGDRAWVYQRKEADAEPVDQATTSSTPATPRIQPTQEGDENRLLRGSHRPPPAPPPSDAAAPATTPTPTASAVPSHPTTDCTRRFHLSRSNSPQPAAGVSKKRSVPAVFVERGVKKQRELLQTIIQEHHIRPAETNPLDRSQTEPTDKEPPLTQQPPSPKKHRRPGTRARLPRSGEAKPTLPPSMLDRDAIANMDELARVMDSWTLAEISKNLDEVEEGRTTSKYSPATSRFKPKAPRQRYFERHPDHHAAERAREKGSAAVMDVDAQDASTDDDGDYVLETYERVPAERLCDRALPAHCVGLLVFDTEPDMVEFFYGNESDSEEEFPEDEEDENAENYYTMEYPDEDLEWDDEFDRNAYHYVNQNASDQEEYDERGFADDVWERCDSPGGVPGDAASVLPG